MGLSDRETSHIERAVPALLSTSPRATAQDGQPDISGSWAGTAKSAYFELGAGGGRGKSAVPLMADITQQGAALEMTITATTEDGPDVRHLTGRIGNGHFWAASDDSEEPLMLTGHVKGKKVDKIKGWTLVGYLDALVEAKYSLKKR